MPVASEVEGIRTLATTAEKKKTSTLTPARRPMGEMGYQERQFREKAGIAEEQRRAGVGQQAKLSRMLKQFGRGDFQQERQRKFTQVQHVARVARSGFTWPGGISLERGKGRQTGTLSRKGADSIGRRKPKPSTTRVGATSEELQKRMKDTRLSVGGMVHLDTRKRWTTSGWQEQEKPHERSYSLERTPRLLRDKPKYWFQKYLGVTSAKPKQLYEQKRLQRSREDKDRQVRMETQERMREALRNKTRYGEEGTNRIMEVWMARQALLFGTKFEGKPL